MTLIRRVNVVNDKQKNKSEKRITFLFASYTDTLATRQIKYILPVACRESKKLIRHPIPILILPTIFPVDKFSVLFTVFQYFYARACPFSGSKCPTDTVLKGTKTTGLSILRARESRITKADRGKNRNLTKNSKFYFVHYHTKDSIFFFYDPPNWNPKASQETRFATPLGYFYFTLLFVRSCLRNVCKLSLAAVHNNIYRKTFIWNLLSTIRFANNVFDFFFRSPTILFYV